jgi:hypothetical protein
MSSISEQYPVRQGPGSEQSSMDLSRALNEWLGSSGPSALFRTCGSCRQMEHTGPAFCKLFNMTPPVDIILKGCEEHQDEMELPFPSG